MSREKGSRLVYSTGGEVPKKEEPESPSTPTAPGGIRLRLEKRASNRVATVVTGLPGTPAEAAALAKALKAGCSTGGTFKDGVLELQGDHREKVEALLAPLGLKSKRAGG
jgi:translation initiation factor 1